MFQTILFYLFAAGVLASAVGVISSRNPVHSALLLVLTFVQSSVLWLLADAEFLAIVLVLVYVGAVMVLFLFVVMMLDVNVEKVRKEAVRYGPIGVLTGLIVVAELGYVVWANRTGTLRQFAAAPRDAGTSNTQELGAVLYTEHFYPFEIAAVILLVAIIAAIVLTMRKRPGLKQQDIGKQVSARREDRVRLVSMPAETKR
ncbi:MAG: NADH-quinone oxidoreductase subunit J [Pseudomonadota bacterium]